ncbi:DNA repair protein RecN [Bacillus rubiinfantis]|uniref:DNA repair protein RecN n=1 Tax=Bacillus rubiinfantis TaxID=1499680 RepID=UPI0005AB8DD2|nr:DNA repair protein RecN [Bacillus rubiinfantis]
MLAELSIKNFAIIDSLSISFQRGLSVLTGETGAGKSIIIDAIHLLTGGRGSAEFVRHGKEKAEIEGLFNIDSPTHPVYRKATEFGIDIDEGMIILRRDIAQTGKSVCRINGKLVTISILREIGATLVDIHGQHEHQELMDETKHLRLLDRFGGKEIASSYTEYQQIFHRYQQTKQRLQALSENDQQMAHRLDLIVFQLNEIQQANLKLHEDEELYEEKRKLANFEKVYEAIHLSFNGLQGEQKGLDWIGLVMGHLENAATIDSSYKEVFETAASCYYQLEDIARNLRNELDMLEFDPQRLNEIEDRLNEINQLKRKYGKTIPEVLEYAAKIEEEIETIQHKETYINDLEQELVSIKKDLSIEAKQLTQIRQSWAKKLKAQIHKELKELYMEKTVFDIRFDTSQEDFTKDGADKLEFYITTNPGEPLKPLSKVASGGELSRIMLALKSIFSKHQGVTSIIFDEVDTGVSGRVAQAIAEKIYKVALDSQVLCISHLPQVAAMADTHLFIAKNVKDGRTSSTVNPLSEEEKIKEIGRMISGAEITNLTKQHAKELLQLALEIKKKF